MGDSMVAPLWKQLGRSDMPRLDRTEMTTVNRRDSRLSLPLGKRDDGSVHEPEWPVAVLPAQVPDSRVVIDR